MRGKTVGNRKKFTGHLIGNKRKNKRCKERHSSKVGGSILEKNWLFEERGEISKWGK